MSLQGSAWQPASFHFRETGGVPGFHAGHPHPLSAIMPRIVSEPFGCRPGGHPVEVCPGTCAIASGKRRTRGRKRIAAPSASQKPTPAPQFATCPRVIPRFPSLPAHFRLCSRIETLVCPQEPLAAIKQVKGDPGPTILEEKQRSHG